MLTMVDYARRSAISLLAVGTLATPAPSALATTARDAATSEFCSSERNPAYAKYMSEAVVRALAASGGVTIGFYDRKTDTTCFTNPSRRFKTASIVKVIIAVALELRAQQEDRDLYDGERDRIERMIIESSNRAARTLWRDLQMYGPYVNQVINIVGMTNTQPGPGGSLGATTTSAQDQINLLKFLTSPDEEALELPRRNYILDLMSRVVPTQRYGVPFGAPPGASWSNKIGYSRLGDSIFNFRTHSIGAIRRTSADFPEYDYMMALLSDHNARFTGPPRVSAAAYVLNQAKYEAP